MKILYTIIFVIVTVYIVQAQRTDTLTTPAKKEASLETFYTAVDKTSAEKVLTEWSNELDADIGRVIKVFIDVTYFFLLLAFLLYGFSILLDYIPENSIWNQRGWKAALVISIALISYKSDTLYNALYYLIYQNINPPQSSMTFSAYYDRVMSFSGMITNIPVIGKIISVLLGLASLAAMFKGGYEFYEFFKQKYVGYIVESEKLISGNNRR